MIAAEKQKGSGTGIPMTYSSSPENITGARLNKIALPMAQVRAHPADQKQMTDAAPGDKLHGATGNWRLDEDLDHIRRLVAGYRRIQARAACS